MVGREAVGVGVLGRGRGGGSAAASRITRPRMPWPRGGGPMQRPLLVVDAVGGEALEQPAVRRQHADRGVAGADHLGGHLYHALEHPVEGHLGDQRRCGYDQPLQPFPELSLARVLCGCLSQLLIANPRLSQPADREADRDEQHQTGNRNYSKGCGARSGAKNMTTTRRLLRKVASAAGPIPPTQADTKTAAKKVMNGSSPPSSGLSRMRSAAMARTAATAIT